MSISLMGIKCLELALLFILSNAIFSTNYRLAQIKIYVFKNHSTMKQPRYAGVVPPSLDFLRVSELENLMRKTQEGDSPPKQTSKFMFFSRYLHINNLLTKLDKQFIVSIADLLSGRKEASYMLLEIILKSIAIVIDIILLVIEIIKNLHKQQEPSELHSLGFYYALKSYLLKHFLYQHIFQYMSNFLFYFIT